MNGKDRDTVLRLVLLSLEMEDEARKAGRCEGEADAKEDIGQGRP